MDCLIIAAGKGTRLKAVSKSKPLTRLGHSTLIDHVICRARSGGAGRFFVVTGYRSGELRRHLHQLAEKRRVEIICIENNDFAKPNGYSVLTAKGRLDGPFILTMCDHIVDPDIIRGLAARPIGEHELILAIDQRLDNPDVDLDDVTRVLQQDGHIRDIGKDLASFNAFDTGVLLATPAVFSAIEHSIAEKGDASLSGGVRWLADHGNARTHDIGDKFWIDMDDAAAFEKARRYLNA